MSEGPHVEDVKGVKEVKVTTVRILTFCLVAMSLAAGFAQARQSRAPGPGQGTAKLAGQVVDRDDKTPLAGVRVILRNDTNEQAVREILTDAEGRYTFPQLAAGTYRISAFTPGRLGTSYGQKKPDRSSVPIVIGIGESVDKLTIAMFRGGVIAGRVSGQNGQPLVGTVVQAYRLRFQVSGRFLEPINVETTTDDQGMYRIFGLSPAEYFVRATPSSGGSISAAPAQASPIVIAVGEERAGVDLSLARVPLVRIRGTLIGPAGPVSNARFTRIFDDGLLRNGEILTSTIGTDGRFLLTNVPAGPLTVLVRAYPLRQTSVVTAVGGAGTGTLWGLVRLVVGTRDVSDVGITMQPGITVSGHIRSVGTAAPPDFARTSIAVLPAGPTQLGDGEMLTGPVDRDGRFSIGGLPPGSYHLTTINLTAPWSFASVVHEGRDRSMTALEVEFGDVTDVVISLTDRPASLSGALRVPESTTVTDYTVVLFPADPASRAARPRAVYAARLNTGAGYSMPRVSPGDYLVAVTDDIETNSWFDPRVLEELSRGATRVTVGIGEAKVQELRVGPIK